MSLRNRIEVPDGVFFITFTCARWLRLFEITNGYCAVYHWFDHGKKQGHCIAGYVIMPDHVHALIGFRNTGKSINSIVANGKRFMAYELVNLLQQQGRNDMLE
jgi:REP element-mobilizing transposase RayT